MKVYFPLNLDIFGNTASAKRILCIARSIKESGIDANFVLYRQYFYGEGIKKGTLYDIPYQYIGFLSSNSYGIIRRKLVGLINEIIFLVHLLFSLKEGDAVIYSGEEYIWDKTVINIVHLRKARYIEELCEYPYGRGIETEKTKKCRKRKEIKLFPKFDGVIAISESLMQYAKNHSNDKCVIVKVPILVDLGQYYLEDKSSETDVKYIFHSGTLSDQKDGILGMIEAFGKVCELINIPIKFICTGNKKKSCHSAEIDELIDRYNIGDKIEFTGYISEVMLRQYLQGASMVIINKHDNQQNNYCFSTKLGEYMAAGKAIIITNVGEAINWLTNGKDALIISPSQNNALVGAIMQLFSDDSLRHSIGYNARITCNNSFNYKLWGNKMKDLFN